VEKNKVVKSQKFEEAASLRDTEKRLQEDLEKAKNHWEEESKHKRYPIDEEAIAEVVSMMTGIPVKRMVQAESEKLRKMSDEMRGMVGWPGRGHPESGESDPAQQGRFERSKETYWYIHFPWTYRCR
jgi:hypothetical protein